MDKAQRNAFRTVLEVEPQRIEFRDVEAGVRYSQLITIRNVTAHSRRIRFVPPGTGTGAGKSSNFQLNFENDLAIAPGLPITVETTFCSPNSPGDFVDRIVITSDDFRLELPLVATMPCAILDFTRWGSCLEVVERGATFC